MTDPDRLRELARDTAYLGRRGGYETFILLALETAQRMAYERAAQLVLSLTGSFNDAQRSALAAVIRALSPLTALPQTTEHETAQHETTGKED